MERNGLDDQLNKRLGAHQVTVDLEQLWSNIEPELPPEKKHRRPVLWWWAAFGLLLTLGLGGDSLWHPLPASEPREIREHAPPGKDRPSENRAEPETVVRQEPIKGKDLPEEKQGTGSELVLEEVNGDGGRQPEISQMMSPTDNHLNAKANSQEPTAPSLPLYDTAPRFLPAKEMTVSYGRPPDPPMGPAIEPVQRTTPGRWSLEWSQIGGIPSYRFTPTSAAFQALADQQASSHRAWWALGTSWQVGYQVHKNLRVKSGLSLTWNYEQFSHSFARDTFTEKSVKTAFFAASPGDTTFFSESQTLRQTIHRAVTHFNRQSMIDIPIGLSYQLEYIGQRWDVEAGALINLRTEREGKTLSNTGDILNISDLQADTGWRVGWYGNIGLILRPEKRVQCILQTHFTYFPNFGMPPNDAFHHQYVLIGGKVGLRYQL